MAMPFSRSSKVTMPTYPGRVRNTRFLDALEYPNLDVRRHDISRDALPLSAFDLVHVRSAIS
jgi:hypothetical protein